MLADQPENRQRKQGGEQGQQQGAVDRPVTDEFAPLQKLGLEVDPGGRSKIADELGATIAQHVADGMGEILKKELQSDAERKIHRQTHREDDLQPARHVIPTGGQKREAKDDEAKEAGVRHTPRVDASTHGDAEHNRTTDQPDPESRAR